MNIQDNELKLRAVEIDDKDLLKDMINDPQTENMVLGWSFPVSDKQQIEWIQAVNMDSRNLKLIIQTKESDAVGLISLTSIDMKNRTATINVKLNRRNKNKGIGYKAVNLILKYAFNELNLNTIAANILEYNEGSQKLFEKCGFVKEGILKNRIYKNGKYHDILSYSITRENSHERNRE
ncbi:GNAT family N-acetyltransferase [Terribacillus saccharophilus]|uniref:GNAT family N-acetyltransferase n=1 Tax=Terribacillus saccharophilus TaxID=361277 RepID=UPI003981E667